jgi:hypothetical protein
MKLDINEIYHQYIIKVIIFSLFLYKRQIRQPSVYKQSVLSFVNKRLAWKIYLTIDTGPKLERDEERDILLDELLNDVISEQLSKVTISFTSPLKEVTMEIDLKNEEKYQNFLYK